jgi:hypothetical protein
MNAPEMRIIDLFENMFKARKIAFETNTCVACGKPAHEFADALSEKEWRISALCQICQDEVFAEPEEDDED